jgi:hypothetical protein
MSREALSLLARRIFVLVIVCCALMFILPSVAPRALAQKQARQQSSHPKTAAPTAKVASPDTADEADNDYSKKIKEYTTESYFRTELVDHLPMSDKVPSPDKVLGYVVGTPNKLTYSKDLYRYYRELARTTPRVRVFSAPEKSEEGKEQMLVAVGDENLLAKLDRYKDITAKLADPRKISEAEASALIGEGKVFYWASGSIHSPETGSCEMLMELAYRLAVEETPFIQAIRKNVIVLITPVLEVDGRDMMVDTYNYRKANPGKNSPGLIFWGKYVAHDNNRDGLGMALALTRNQMKTFLEYHPAILHDLHESVPFLYTSTGTGPYNAWLDPITIDEWQLLAYHEIEEMTKRGVPGVWTHGFYDGWAPNYMFYVANGHNAIGRFYETFGNGGADTIDRTVNEQSRRDWFRPNPAQPRVKWSIRNNINLQQSAILLAMNFVSNNKDRFLQNFYIKSKRSVAKALNEGPYAYVIPADQSRLVEAADMVNLLRLMGVEVHTADKEIAVKDQKFPAGSYVVRMDQPYSRMADMMLDTQYYNVNDPRPYDDTGWTLGPSRNVKTVRVFDKADQSILKAPMTLLTADARVSGKLNGSATAGYVINHNTENTLATLRFKLKDVKIEAAEDSFKVGDRQFNAGSFIVKTDGNGSNLRQRLEAAVQELGLTALGVAKLPEVKLHELAVPRIAILHTWTNTQNDGWYRIEFDKFQIPYSYISDQVVRNTGNLREKYDVIIFPPLNGSSQSIVNGIPLRGDAIPWKQSELTPNMGLSPDQTDDMRGGMGLAGVVNLQKFVADGGLFIVVANSARLPIDFGLTNGVSIQEPRSLQARGSIYNARFSDRKSPIAYGYDETMPIYFNQAPLFRVAPAIPVGGGEDGPGAAVGRPSGRGSLTDADIVQGMPLAAPSERPSPRPGEEQLTEEQRLQLGAYYTPPNQRPRVVLRFAADEKALLISGMLAGGSELANAPAVIDVPVGRGHVVMFANNPMWRHQTQGSFFLVFNAVLNFDSLNTERAVQPPAKSATTTGDDNDQK